MTPTHYQCTATNRRGTRCKAWAVPGTQPPLCAAHGGASNPPGAPTGNKNAVTHGFYANSAPKTNSRHVTLSKAEGPTIDAIIEDLHQRQITLSHYLDKAAADENFSDLLPIFALHAQTASRLGRLLRDRRALTGDAGDGLAEAVAAALDELCTMLNVPEGSL